MDISVSAFAASILKLRLFAMSPSDSIPVTLPFSTTGRRRIFSEDINVAAALTSSAGETEMMFRDIMSLTGLFRGSFGSHAAQDNVPVCDYALQLPVIGADRQRAYVVP